MSSVHEVIPWAGHVNYAASKGGIALMMRTLAQELAGQRIRINAIAPGAIATRINAENTQGEAGKRLLELIPYGRVGDVEDIANALSGWPRTCRTMWWAPPSPWMAACASIPASATTAEGRRPQPSTSSA